MKQFLLASVFFLSTAAFAQMDGSGRRAGPHNIAADASFNAGGFALGGEYEYMYDDSTGIGGFFHMFPKDTSDKRPVNGLFVIGAEMGHHFYKKNWDLNFAPGLAILNIQQALKSPPAPGDTTTLGPSLKISLLNQLTSAFALGFEFSNYYCWFNTDYSGFVRTDLAVKGRFTF
jgi:hypothetical protein